MLSLKITTFHFKMLKLLCGNPDWRLLFLGEIGSVATAFLVEYVIAVVMGQDSVEVDAAAYADDLVGGVTATDVVVVALADTVFDNDYIIACVVVDVAVAFFIVVYAGDAGFSAVVHVDA